MTCVICSTNYSGYGNNAEPVCKGVCCDACNLAKVIPARIELLPKTLLKLWKSTIEDNLDNMYPEDFTTVQEVYDGLVEEHDYHDTFIDEDELTQAQMTELLGKFDEDDDLTDIQALLFRYGRLMLYIKKDWVCAKIQEINV